MSDGMDIEYRIEPLTAALVALLVNRHGHDGASRYRQGVAAHGKTTGQRRTNLAKRS